MKKADLLVPSVSAASIVAKVARDNYMRHLDGVFPGYKFRSHVGYGTAAHQAALKELGTTPLHRHSFAPIAKLKPVSRGRTAKQIGDAAENQVAVHLEALGHEIIARNWRTKYCEIDIVSRCGDTIYFTEVKYRKNDAQGGGFAAITAKKQRQMTFAAELFAVKHQLVNHSLRLAAADVTGQPPSVKDFLEIG